MKRLSYLLTISLLAASSMAQAKFNPEEAIERVRRCKPDYEAIPYSDALKVLVKRQVQLQLKMDSEPNLIKKTLYQNEIDAIASLGIVAYKPTTTPEQEYVSTIEFYDKPGYYLEHSTNKYGPTLSSKQETFPAKYNAAREKRKLHVPKFDLEKAEVDDFKRRWEYVLKKEQLQGTRYFFDFFPGSNYSKPVSEWYEKGEPFIFELAKTNSNFKSYLGLYKVLYMKALVTKKGIKHEETTLAALLNAAK